VLCTGALADKQQDRLQLSKSLDAITIDDSQGDPVEQILEATNGVGTDRGVEAVGYQAHDHSGDEHPELVLDNLVKTVRTTGGVGVRDLIIAGGPSRVGSSPTSSASTRPSTPRRSSTSDSTAGPRSCSTRRRT
jgi:hypothetical protein